MDSKDYERLIKQEIYHQLTENVAFTNVLSFIDEVPYDKIGIRPAQLPYSFYEVFYHLWLSQRDILDFISAENYNEKKWPEDYWPKEQQPRDEYEWKRFKTEFREDFKTIQEILENEKQFLLRPVKFATNDTQTLLRELLLILNHNAYHIGQLQIILRLLGVK